jgi:hypothetical protein
MSKVIVNNKMNEYFGNLALEVGINAVRKCAEKYGFDAEEAIELCGLDSIDNHVVFNKTKKGAAKKESTAEVQLKLAKPKFPFPYCGEYKKECCQGLKYNRGLFTQCLFIKTAESDYCKRCSSQAEKNEHGKPDCGSIQDRLNISFMDFRDPKGRAPISFVKVMRKLKISQEALLEEAGKFNFEIHSIHFVDPPPPGKKGRKAAAATDEDDETPLKKGRPSKNKEVVVSTFTEEADLFATLTKKAAATATATEPQQQTHVEPDFFFIDETKQDDNNKPHTLSSLNLNSLVCPDSESSSSPSTTPTAPPPAPTAVKTAAKETSTPETKKTTTKPAKKMTKEEKEAEKEAKIAAKEAEKAAKIAAKEAEKAAAKLAAKLAAKKTKAQEEKAPKKTKAQAEEEEAKKKAQAEEEAKKKTQAEEEESDEEDEDEEDEDEEDEELAKQEEDEDKADELASVQLDRFKYAGKSYFKDQFDVIYDMGNGNQIDPYPIGKWNKKKRSIEFNESKIAEKDEGSDEEEEDEYEE